MKRSAYARQIDEIARQRGLLVTLSDDIALPLLQIKSSLELMQSQNFAKSAARRHNAEAVLSVDAGLQLIEAYRLLLAGSQADNLPMEPLAVRILLDEIAHRLTPYAKQYDTKLTVNVQPRLAPALAHQPSLASALEILGTSLIRAQAAQSDQKSYQLLLGAHRSSDNVIAAGVFSGVQGISDRTLRAARALLGRARQPLPAVPAGAAAGVLVADMLCAQLWQPLRAAAHNNLSGLATSIPSSQQLQFV